jgi:hypothetical protein
VLALPLVYEGKLFAVSTCQQSQYVTALVVSEVGAPALMLTVCHEGAPLAAVLPLSHSFELGPEESL